MSAVLHAIVDAPVLGNIESGIRIGVDVGGTFTDLILAAPDKTVQVFKVPTVPQDPAEGVMNALTAAAAAESGFSVTRLLHSCTLFVHGTTIATNILLERKGATVGCILTDGFRDSLEIRRGVRTDPWDHRAPYSPVLVPRYLRRTVKGRIDRHGEETAPLDQNAVKQAVELLRGEGVEAIAICLFNSFLNAKHERECADLVAAAFPEAIISVSSDVAPVIGEYERASTAVLNAYVAPRTVSYLLDLDRRLEELGLRRRLLLIQNNGGAVSVDQIADRPVTLLLSGPAAGVGALNYYRRASRSDSLISMEIGGTSCDVILMSSGNVNYTDHLEIDGYHATVSSIEVHTIGAGGGTIAGVDEAGLLFVGPQGAGARPGPACYGLGGVSPTVTDAQVVLGRLSPETYAGGAIRIDARLAHEAIERSIARPLGISCEASAAGIVRLMEQKLLHAVQRISIERGHDPRRFTLVPGGGAGALHGANVARLLGCPRVYVPRLAGAFCALGMLNADVRHDYAQVFIGGLDDSAKERLVSGFAELEKRVRKTLANEGFGREMELIRALDLHYSGQQWDITIDLRSEFNPQDLRQLFEAEHERLFGHIQPNGSIQITKIRVAGIGRLPMFPETYEPEDYAEPTPSDLRSVWVDEVSGWAELAVYRGVDLKPGHSVGGPAIVDEKTTTVLVGSGDRLVVDRASNFVIEVPSKPRL